MPAIANRRKYLDAGDYTVAWIAPLEIETLAAKHMLDEVHEGQFPDDAGVYQYIAGTIWGHNVVIATFPSNQPYGTSTAAALIAHIKTAFRNIRFGLLVGVAAGIPRLSGSLPLRDIRLGDVLVALPDGENAGVIAYDLGKATVTGFEVLQRGYALDRTAANVAAAIGSIKMEAPRDSKCFLRYYNEMKDEEHKDGTFGDPGQERDCFYDGDGQAVPRAPRPSDRRTRVWYGPIGSGNQLMRDNRERDELQAKHNILGLEMEAAGIMNVLPVGVIRGVCDYADPHKNKEWQPYAAAMAAAYAKAILEKVPLPLSSLGSADDKTAPVQDDRQSSGSGGIVNYTTTVNGTNYGPVAGSIVFNGPYYQQAPGPPVKTLDELALEACRNHFYDGASEHLFVNIESHEAASWLFKQEAFREWESWGDTEVRKASPGLLTIRGDAFTGKSVMMGAAITRSLEAKKAVTLYHFFGHMDADSIVMLFRALVGQLILQLPNKPWEHIRRWGEKIQAERLAEVSSRIQLQKAFKNIVLACKADAAAENENRAIRIFIDGLDNDHGQLPELVEFLDGLVTAARDADVNLGICVSGRYFPDEPLVTIIDLASFIDEQIGMILRKKFKFLQDPINALQLLTKLRDHGAHNFHWVKRIAEDLYEMRNATTFGTLMKLAAEAVNTHEDLYCHAIRYSKSSPNGNMQLRVLHIALATLRPLHPDEFRHACAFAAEPDFAHSTMAIWEKSEFGLSAVQFRGFLKGATGGLLQITTWTSRSRFAQTEEEAGASAQVKQHVTFMHAATGKWLRSENGLAALEMESLSHLEKNAHLLMFNVCGMALNKSRISRKGDVHLTDYACGYWLRHARACGDLINGAYWPAFMRDCTTSTCKRFIKKQRAMGDGGQLPALENEDSMFVLLSTIGSPEVLEKHIDTCDTCYGVLPDESDENEPKDVFMRALSNAIMAENVETTTRLLDMLPPQHIDALFENGMTPLYRVCYFSTLSRSGNFREQGVQLVKTLIARDAYPCQDYIGGTFEYPLHLAIGTDNVPLIKALCDNGDQRDLLEMFQVRDSRSGWTALHYAVKWDCKRRDQGTRQKTLEVLLELAPVHHGLLEERTSDGFKTPLDLAKEPTGQVVGGGAGNQDSEDEDEEEQDSEDDDEEEQDSEDEDEEEQDSEDDDEEEQDSEDDEFEDEAIVEMLNLFAKKDKRLD